MKEKRPDLGRVEGIDASAGGLGARSQDEITTDSKLLNLALEISESAVWKFDFEKNEMLEVNEQWKSMYDLGEKNILESWLQRIHEDDRGEVQQSLQEHIDGKTNKYVQIFRYWNKRGSGYKWIKNTGQIIKRNAKGEPLEIIGVSLDITEERDALVRLKAEKKFKDSITENSSSGIYIYNPGLGINTYTNKTYEEILGYTQKEINDMSGEEFMSLFHPDDQKHVMEHMDKVINQKKRSKIRYQFKHKKGHYVTCYSIDSPYELDEKGNVISFIGSFIDISDFQQKIQRELVREKDKAIQANEQKDVFLSNLSHEIRTPMNAVVGFSQLLKKSNITNKNKDKFIQQINTNSKQLLTLIDDILDLTRIETGEFKLSTGVCDVKKNAGELVEYFREIIDADKGKSKLKIKLEAPPKSTYNLIEVDCTKLQQVLSNLLENAIKYSKKGIIKLSYTIEKDKIHLSVSDQGCGIKKADQKRIFEKYTRVETRAEIGGTGLGLAISCGVVKAMGGKITVDSIYGKGSVFSFSIPVKTIDPKTLVKSDKPAKNTESKIKKILVVDDSPAVHFYFDSVLSDYKIEILHANDGEEALKIFKKNQGIGLVLLDIKMPKMGGEEVFEKIRALDQEVPIVAQSAYAMNDEVNKYKKLGFTDYLTKPIDETRLFDLLD